MFPYPSGNLHMGHVRVYMTSDTLAKYHRMIGKNVIFPMGWDSFGLPAENAALSRGIDPKQWTDNNISIMKEQLCNLGCDFDWNTEITTSHASYYQWTQFIFLKLYEHGLAYQKWAEVDWDPVDKTVLAREQVDANGISWRSGSKVEKKRLKQWFLKTTAFSKSLYDELDKLDKDGWKDVADIQREWIGHPVQEISDKTLKKDWGTYADFPIERLPGTEIDSRLSVFMDRPEILAYTGQYNKNGLLEENGGMAIAIKSEHELNLPELYDKNFESDSDMIKKLIIKAAHPFLEDDYKIPIFVVDDIEYDIHNDSKFVSQYSFTIDAPSCPTSKDLSKTREFYRKYVDPNILDSISKMNDSHGDGDIEEIRHSVKRHLRKNCSGGYDSSSRLRDWLVSRQRKWGTPVPIIHCPECKVKGNRAFNINGVYPVAYSKLPIIIDPTQTINHTTCPVCHCPLAYFDTDTLDTFVDSSWYFSRFLDSQCDSAPFRNDVVDAYLPVDLYVGGKEHATLHLYFARFMQHFLHSIGMTQHKEPFKSLLMIGQVTNKSFFIQESGVYIPRERVDFKRKSLIDKVTKLPVQTKWEKMSKSKFNGINPQELIDSHGIDTLRLIALSQSSPCSQKPWISNDKNQSEIIKFQDKLWLTIFHLRKQRTEPIDFSPESLAKLRDLDRDLRDKTNYFIAKINFHFQNHNLHLVIDQLESFCLILRNYPLVMLAKSYQYQLSAAKAIIVLSTFAPHFASELWRGISSLPKLEDRNVNDTENGCIKWDSEVLEQSWPVPDPVYPLPCIVSFELKEHQSHVFKLQCSTLNKLSASGDKILPLMVALNHAKLIVKDDIKVYSDQKEASLKDTFKDLNREKSQDLLDTIKEWWRIVKYKYPEYSDNLSLPSLPNNDSNKDPLQASEIYSYNVPLENITSPLGNFSNDINVLRDFIHPLFKENILEFLAFEKVFMAYVKLRVCSNAGCALKFPYPDRKDILQSLINAEANNKPPDMIDDINLKRAKMN
ncbi:unnamed protein product [Gordionus sp. m RMFG-2023]